MVKSNTTISVESEVLKAAKNKAALLDTSVSELCNNFLMTFTQGEMNDEKNKQELLEQKKELEMSLADSRNRMLELDRELEGLETKKDSEAQQKRKAEIDGLLKKAQKIKEKTGRKDLGLWK